MKYKQKSDREILKSNLDFLSKRKNETLDPEVLKKIEDKIQQIKGKLAEKGIKTQKKGTHKKKNKGKKYTKPAGKVIYRSLKKKTKAQKEYQKFISGRKWESIKRKYYKNHPKRCAVCGTTRKIELHHLSYANKYNPKDDELAPMCDKHHKEFHEEYGTKTFMFAEHEAFLRSNK